MLRKITIEGCTYNETTDGNLFFKLDTRDVNVLGHEHADYNADAFYKGNLILNGGVSIFYTSMREDFFEEHVIILAMYRKVSDMVSDPYIEAFKKNPYIHSLLI